MINIIIIGLPMWLSGKDLPAVQETQVQPLGQEDPLEKGKATHSSILAWRTHGQRRLVGYSPWRCRVRHSWAADTFTYFHIESLIGDMGLSRSDSIWILLSSFASTCLRLREWGETVTSNMVGKSSRRHFLPFIWVLFSTGCKQWRFI